MRLGTQGFGIPRAARNDESLVGRSVHFIQLFVEGDPTCRFDVMNGQDMGLAERRNLYAETRRKDGFIWRDQMRDGARDLKNVERWSVRSLQHHRWRSPQCACRHRP